MMELICVPGRKPVRCKATLVYAYCLTEMEDADFEQPAETAKVQTQLIQLLLYGFVGKVVYQPYVVFLL